MLFERLKGDVLPSAKRSVSARECTELGGFGEICGPEVLPGIEHLGLYQELLLGTNLPNLLGIELDLLDAALTQTYFTQSEFKKLRTCGSALVTLCEEFDRS